MTITPEMMISNLREWLDDTYSGAIIRLSKSDVGTLLNRIEAQAAWIAELENEQSQHDQQIAEMQSKIDLRNRALISKTERCEAAEKALAALRGSIKTAESFTDDADLSFTIGWYDDERNDGIQIAMWLKELRRRRELAAPVAVPDDNTLREMVRAWNRAHTCDEGYQAMREVLHLNSGSKPE